MPKSTREKIADILEKEPTLPVLKIAHRLRISPQAVYKHLEILREEDHAEARHSEER